MFLAISDIFKRVKIALLNNGDGESWDEIKDEKFWKNIYCMSDDYSLLGEAKYARITASVPKP